MAQLALLPGVLEQRDAARQLPLTLARRRGCVGAVELLRAAGAHERGAERVHDGVLDFQSAPSSDNSLARLLCCAAGSLVGCSAAVNQVRVKPRSDM